MKHHVLRRRCGLLPVAPRAGAWIETRLMASAWQTRRVAPRAGAWIETSLTAAIVLIARRRPPRGGVD